MNIKHLELVLDVFHKEINSEKKHPLRHYEYPIIDEDLSDSNKDVVIWYAINTEDFSISTAKEVIYKY